MLRIDPDPTAVSFVHSAMATEFSFQLCGDDPEFLKQTAYEASLFIDSLERKLSLYQESSDVSRINALKAGESTRISSEMTECLKQAFQASVRFKGRFNPFIGRAAINSKKQESEFSDLPELSTDWQEPDAIIAFNPDSQTVEKIEENYLLDLGAIGKGFTLDQVALFLEEWDTRNGLLNAGGSSLLLLPESDSQAWKIEYGDSAIQDKAPFPPDMSLASSGLSFQNEHIIDPMSGKSRSCWKRAHVLAPNAALADAACTAAMLLNEKELRDAIEEENDISILLIREHVDERIAIGDHFARFATRHS